MSSDLCSSSSMSSIKPRLKLSSGEACTFEQLVVRHPHYDEFNTLLKLPALGKEDTFDYNTALTICGIICDNSYNSGWLARSKDGTNICNSKAPLDAGVVYYFATSDKSCK